jgi:hypothetical protein
VAFIPNCELSLVHLPGEHSPVTEWHLFAAGFNGYGFCGDFESTAALSEKILKAFQLDAASLSQFSLSELRANLFFEHRRFVNFGRDPDADEFRLWVATVKEMERRIRNHELD